MLGSDTTGTPTPAAGTRLPRIPRQSRRRPKRVYAELPGSGSGAAGVRPGGSTRPMWRRADRRSVRVPLPGRDPIWARLLIIFGVLLMFASGGVIGAGKVLANRYDDSVKKDTLLADDARTGAGVGLKTDENIPRTKLTGPLNFLLIGSDARVDDPEGGQRSDSIIIAHVPVTMDRVYLLSIPRDLRVEIPPFEQTGFHGARDKINAAFEYGGGGSGGIRLLSATLTKLLGIRFDGAGVVDFDGFKDVVRVLGGVDMCIDHRVVSEHMGFDNEGKFLAPHRGGRAVVYEAGCHHFDDWEALDLVRQRYSLPDGDYGRQKNQQRFLRALLSQAQKKGVLTNPLQMDRMIRAVAGTLTVDTNGASLADLVFSLRDIRPDSIVGLTVPSEPTWIGGTSYILAFQEAEGLYKAMVDDKVEDWAVANPTWTNRP
jgi:LCP family protein required for cell wall assembly